MDHAASIVRTFALGSFALVTGARVWVDGLEEERRAGFQQRAALDELYRAIIENELAGLLHSDGKYDKAEPKYRNALDTFRRLREDSRAAPTLLALATLLTQREEATDEKLIEAETYLLDALEIFRDDPETTRVEQHQVLALLRWMYGPEVWDLPEELADIETQLADLNASETRPDSGSPPDPSN